MIIGVILVILLAASAAVCFLPFIMKMNTEQSGKPEGDTLRK